jgi:hypothetical protein
MNHRQRFERWRRLLPKPTAYLVEQVLAAIVPRFEAGGYAWYADYAGGDPKEISASTIPLQRRAGQSWPTVEIRFGNRGRPFFQLEFAELPPECRRFGREIVPREIAIVIYAPAYFLLCKGRLKSLDGTFGYRWFAPRPRAKLDAELRLAVDLIPFLLQLLDRGIPHDWLTRERGYVDPNVRLLGGWHTFRRRDAASAV